MITSYQEHGDQNALFGQYFRKLENHGQNGLETCMNVNDEQ